VTRGQFPGRRGIAAGTSSLHEGSLGWGSPALAGSRERDPRCGVQGEGRGVQRQEGELPGAPRRGRTRTATPSSNRTALKKIILMLKIDHLFIPEQDPTGLSQHPGWARRGALLSRPAQEEGVSAGVGRRELQRAQPWPHIHPRAKPAP